MTIIQCYKEELQKLEDHDCKTSEDSGCKTCERILYLKNRLANYEKRKLEGWHTSAPRTKLVVESDCDGVYFNQINL
jgi:hypothetical protein